MPARPARPLPCEDGPGSGNPWKRKASSGLHRPTWLIVCGPAPHPRKATKTARFLDLVTERHGSLASVRRATAGIAADLAPLAT